MNALRHGLFVVVFCFCVLPASQCPAAIEWNLTYDDSGFGFDDPAEGATRRATIDAVTDYINSVIDVTGTVDFHFNVSQNVGQFTTPLGSAGPIFAIQAGQTGFTNGQVFEHAVNGFDPFPSDPDAFATFDFGYTWNSDLSAPALDEFDLFSVALHEMTHALGFLSLVTPSGASALQEDLYSVYDSFLELGDGTDLFDELGNFLGTPADLVSDNVFFNGPNATAANGGDPVKIYAPDPYEDGSSISHLDFAGAVMEPSIASGVTNREYTDVELGILADIGWNVTPAAVPEPSTTVLLGLVGLTCAAGSRWRRRRAA